MANDKIDKLTPAQEALIPEYLEKYRGIGLSTTPTNRPLAEEYIKRAYAYLKMAPPTITWCDNPFLGARKAAQILKGDDNVTRQEVADQASQASYGSFEAYWVSFYAFIGEQFPVDKDPLLGIVQDLVKELGVYWTFDGHVVLTPKPSAIYMRNEKLHNLEGLALEYPDGTGIYALDGVRYPSLLEVRLASLNKYEEK